VVLGGLRCAASEALTRTDAARPVLYEFFRELDSDEPNDSFRSVGACASLPYFAPTIELPNSRENPKRIRFRADIGSTELIVCDGSPSGRVSARKV